MTVHGEGTSDTGEVIAWIEQNYPADVEQVAVDSSAFSVATVPLMVRANGVHVTSLKTLLDEYRLYPERAKGTTTIGSQESFAAFVTRHRAPNSVIFANDDRANPSFTAVFDYHDAGVAGAVDPADTVRARFGEHRAKFAVAVSDEWKAWDQAAKAGFMDQQRFAEFIEDRISDVAPPPVDLPGYLADLSKALGGDWADASKLAELARGLQINVGETVKSHASLSTGEIAVTYETKHSDPGGGQVRVPALFGIRVPVFHRGAVYFIGVRLRYRVQNGNITWAVKPYRPDLSWDHAFDEMSRAIEAATQVTMFLGTQDTR